MSSFPVLKPDLQVSLYSRLQALRERYLIESLKKTVGAEDFDLKTADAELAKYADAKNLKRIVLSTVAWLLPPKDCTQERLEIAL